MGAFIPREMAGEGKSYDFAAAINMAVKSPNVWAVRHF